jgi:Mrp family chromosome partitioning ATPase/capsular polysaccharide biosynthesis protein
MNLLHYLRTLRRRWKLLVVLTLVGTAVGVAFGVLQPSQARSDESRYIAKHTLSADPSRSNLEQLAILVNTGEVPNRVAERIGGSPGSLSTEVRGRAIPQASLLQITAVSADPQRAVQLADTFAEELMRFELEIPDSKKQQQIETLRRGQEEARAAYADALEAAKQAQSEEELERVTKAKNDAIRRFDEIQAQIDKVDTSSPKQPSLSSLSTAEAVPASQQQAREALAEPAQRAARDSDTTTAAPATSGGRALGTPLLAVVGGVAGLLMGVVLVLVIDRLDPRIRTKVDAEEAFGWPVIAYIPLFSKSQRSNAEVESYLHPRSRVAEAYRSLRSALLFSDIGRAIDPKPGAMTGAPASLADPSTFDDRPNGSGTGHDRELGDTPGGAARALTIMITSPGPAEGKTTTVANLAAVFAEASFSVFVLNCDFRRPRLETLLGGNDTPGHPGSCSIPGVTVLTHVFEDDGSANPATVVAAQRKAISEARPRYDVVLLDTAPLLATNDASDVLAEADQVLVVGRAGKTNKESADRAAEFLDRRRAPVVGVLMTAVSDTQSGYYYNYYGTRGYYADELQTRREPPDAPAESELASTKHP